MEIAEFHVWIEGHLTEIASALPDNFELTLIARDRSATAPGSGFILSNDDPDAIIAEVEASKDTNGKMVVDFRSPNG